MPCAWGAPITPRSIGAGMRLVGQGLLVEVVEVVAEQA